MMHDLVVLTGTHALTYCFAVMALGRWVFGRLTPSAPVSVLRARLFFALVTALSCSMFLLIMFDITGIVSRPSILAAWRVDLFTMLILLVFVIPFFFFYAFARENQFRIPHGSLAIAVSLFCMYLFLFWKLGNYFPMLKPGAQSGFFYAEHATARVSVIGVTLSAFLSAYGAVVTYGLIFFQFDLHSSGLKHQQTLMQGLVRMIARRKYELFSAGVPSSSSSSSSSGSSSASGLRRGNSGTSSKESSWLKTIWTATPLSEDARVAEKRDAVASYGHQLQMAQLQLQSAVDAEKRRAYERTLRGFAYKLLLMLIFTWNIIQIVSAMLTIIVHRNAERDPITTLFLYASKVDVAVDVERWAQPLSFVFMGISIVSSMRSFFLTLQNMLVKYKVAQYIPVSWVILTVAYLVGSYSLSFILLSRMSIPAQYRETLSLVLGEIEFSFYHRWRDCVFVVSAVLAIFGYGIWSVASYSIDKGM
jgi:hypothetical protein